MYLKNVVKVANDVISLFLSPSLTLPLARSLARALFVSACVSLICAFSTIISLFLVRFFSWMQIYI